MSESDEPKYRKMTSNPTAVLSIKKEHAEDKKLF